MKNKRIYFNGKLIALTLVTVVAMLLAHSCKEEKKEPVIVLNGFSPASGRVDDVVTLTGTNFRAAAAENQVSFNGTAAILTSATTTQLVTKVPSGATTGKITVRVGSQTVSSANEFIVIQPPTITSFSPASASVGASVSIIGSNFSTTASENTVSFNGANAAVTAATDTQLTVTVPLLATTGKITVKVGSQTASSTSDFVFVLPLAPTIASFSPTTGTVNVEVTITGTNFRTTANQNQVSFNGTAATITSATATQIVTKVPSGATTGKITVQIGTQTATSANDFVFVPPPPAPIITSFAPASGAIGATVTITGLNFRTVLSENTVKFNSVAATVTAATATQLTVTVPSGATTGKITLEVGAQTATSTNDFVVIVIPPPAITGFTPPSGQLGTEVSINGSNFGTSGAIVRFNGVAASQITLHWDNLLRAIVPTGATTGKITVQVGAVTATSATDFTVTAITAPVITSFSPLSGLPGTWVRISGSNFSASNNKVFFNGVEASVDPSSNTEITAYLPQGATTGKISVEANGLTGVSTQDFTVLQPSTDWVRKADFPQALNFPGLSAAFSIGTKGYFYVNSNTAASRFWEYDATANSWTRKADPPVSFNTSDIGFAIAAKGYVFRAARDVSSSPEFYEYDQATDKWAQKANYPGTSNISATAFAIGSKGYVGLGNIKGTATNSKDFYEYDPASNAWTKKTDYPGTGGQGAVGFGIGTKGYMGLGSGPGTNKDFYEYDPATNTWVVRANFPGEGRFSPVYTTLNNKGYVGMDDQSPSNITDFWEYNPATNAWVKKTDFAGGPRNRCSGLGINGKIYVGFGSQVSDDKEDIWEYTPQ
jgi:hypothetical protein